ncbi:MAG TPA: hypothetical protein EYP04_09780, partial [Anaerolineae bacterium]|nr:hypothetical protein [Anaerolineae bacterium]
MRSQILLRKRELSWPDPTTVALWGVAILSTLLIVWRVYGTVSSGKYDLSTWGFQIANGAVQGAVYALIALGYTL